MKCCGFTFLSLLLFASSANALRVLPHRHVDLGEVALTKNTATYTFTLANDRTDFLLLENATTQCGCNVHFTQASIPFLQSGELRMDCSLSEYGYHSKSVQLQYSDDTGVHITNLQLNYTVTRELPEEAKLDTDAVMNIDYEVECSRNNTIAVSGTVNANARNIRFVLPTQLHHRQMIVPLGTTRDQVTTDAASKGCAFKKFDVSVVPLKYDASDLGTLALRHAPFIVSRDSQLFKSTDVPLEMAYSILKESNKPDEFTLVYTVVFSDEDTKITFDDVEAQQNRYGRKTDIEGIYRVTFRVYPDHTLHVIRREYETSYFGTGIGEVLKDFTGDFIPNSDHPILYNDCRIPHNVMRTASAAYAESVRPMMPLLTSPLIGSHLVPSIKISYPLAREWIEFSNLWISDFSDQELLRENKIKHPTTDYLYILAEGSLLQTSSWKLHHVLPDRSIEVDEMPGSFDRIGQDLYHRQSFSALYFPRTSQRQLLKGEYRGWVDFTGFSDSTKFTFYFKIRQADGTLKLVPVTDHFKKSDRSLDGYVAFDFQ